MNNFFFISVLLIFILTNNIAISGNSKGIIQKGDLVCEGDIKMTMLTVENNSNMFADLITTKEIQNNNLSAKNLFTKYSTIETIKGSTDKNIVKVKNIRKKILKIYFKILLNIL